MLTVAVEGCAFVGRLASRRGMYHRARALADTTGRPLVVVGAVSAGWVRGRWAQYACGDVPCVDVAGCAACGTGARDVTVRGAIATDDGGAVVLVQHTLEYVDDPEAAWREITRAAGGEDHVFVSRNQPWATVTRVATGARWTIDNAPPTGPFAYHAVAREPRVAVYRRRGSEWT